MAPGPGAAAAPALAASPGGGGSSSAAPPDAAGGGGGSSSSSGSTPAPLVAAAKAPPGSLVGPLAPPQRALAPQELSPSRFKLPSPPPSFGTFWGLLVLSLAYLHHSTTGFALPSLLPIISNDLALTDSEGALLTAGYTVRGWAGGAGRGGAARAGLLLLPGSSVAWATRGLSKQAAA